MYENHPSRTHLMSIIDKSQWIEGNLDGASNVLAGSTGPTMSLSNIIEISTDSTETANALKLENLPLKTGSRTGDDLLRARAAGLYDQNKVSVTADDVVISNGTTGASLLIFQALLSPGDHIVVAYPAYEGLIGVPEGLGAEIAYWNMDPENDWKASIEDLKSLLRPSTRMIVVNNPHNPTGSILSTSDQAEIIKLASEHNIIVFADEIFRPLFHSTEVPTSLMEHSSYDRTIVAGSLSKTWGLSGVRIGWVVTRNKEIREACIKIRKWAVQCVSVIDEVVGREILSERCKDRILSNTLSNARANLAVLKNFVEQHKRSVSCCIPKGAATAFVKFSNQKNGQAVDDVKLCLKLKQETGVLLSPGSLTFGSFGPAKGGDFKGYVRVHITVPPERFKQGFESIGAFLRTSSFADLEERGVDFRERL